MEDKRKNNGGHSNGGRKPKAEEQQLIEKLSPLLPKAFKAFETALDENKDWAVKLFFQYNFGMPKQVVTNTNINIDQKELDDAEVQKIKEKFNATY